MYQKPLVLILLILPFGGTDTNTGWLDPRLSNHSPILLDLSPSIPLCRHKWYLPQPLYELDTCAYCYRYIHHSVFGKKLNFTQTKWKVGNKVYDTAVLQVNGELILANSSDLGSPIWDTFVSEDGERKWTDCCNAARECCYKQIEEQDEGAVLMFLDDGQVEEHLPKQSTKCPSTWDGWQCWGATESGVTAKSFCPSYIFFLTAPPTCSIPLEKECTAQGEWYRHNGTRQEWTNYEPCGTATLSIQLRRAYVHIGAYALSIVAIVPALFIFFAYKQLRVHRIILHENLFISILMNGIFVILFKTVVMINEIQHKRDSLVEQNHIGCRILIMLTKYSRMTTYLWMFCEVFYLMGWVFPILPCMIYSIYRQGWANENCWVMPEEGWDWVLNGPSLLSLVINACFLINIIRVLVTKLRATHAQEPSQYRKAVRATLVLLPLFGLHFLITVYRPPTSAGVCLWTEIYFYANDILDGIQGFLVALIFCYFNGEVSSLLKRTWMRLKDEYFGGRGNGGRSKRSGSFGRSVVTTQVYSSVPPSPSPDANNANCIALTEIDRSVNCNTNLLTVNGNKPVNLMVTTTSASTKNGMESTSSLI